MSHLKILKRLLKKKILFQLSPSQNGILTHLIPCSSYFEFMMLYTFLFLNITGISIPFKFFGKLNLPSSPPTLLSQGKNKKTTQIFQRILILKKQVLMLNCNRKCWKLLIIPTYYVEAVQTVNTCQHYRALTGITKTIYEIYTNITPIL